LSSSSILFPQKSALAVRRITRRSTRTPAGDKAAVMRRLPQRYPAVAAMASSVLRQRLRLKTHRSGLSTFRLKAGVFRSGISPPCSQFALQFQGATRQERQFRLLVLSQSVATSSLLSCLCVSPITDQSIGCFAPLIAALNGTGISSGP